MQHKPHFEYCAVKRLSNDVSVFTTEMIASLMAMQQVEEMYHISVVVCSDSYSVLNSLNSGKSAARQDSMKLYNNLNRVNQTGVRVEFLWVPAHVGVEGNEEVYTLAKSALRK